MAPKPLPYADVIPRDKIQDYIYRKTGMMLHKSRITRFINTGEIRTITRPKQYGGGTFSRRVWLDAFIESNS